jgi:hypothetical protein
MRTEARTIGAGLIAAVALACSDAAGELAGSMMQDAGETITDAGERMRDAGMRMLGDAAIEAGALLDDAGVTLMDAATAVDADVDGASA